MDNCDRRHYEIDALRVIALGLLIIYHVFICYQPFSNVLRFIPYERGLEKYWFIGEMLNIWRIPVLFLISGMALSFVLRHRTVKEAVHDRLLRIVPPLIFGSIFIFPWFPILFAVAAGKPIAYAPNPGHLWFLLNLVSYTMLLIPLMIYVKRKPDNILIRILRKGLPYGLLVILPLPLMLESALSKPELFALFPIRFWYGFVTYAMGYLLISMGEVFWVSVRKVCHFALPLAVLFYLGRIGQLDWAPVRANHWSTAFESGMWMLAFVGYGSWLFDRPSRMFAYLNKAVFPVYIIHLPVQQFVSVVIYRLKLEPELTFGLHVLMTFALCGLIYEYVILRSRLLHPLMGLKVVKPAAKSEEPNAWTKFGTRLTLYVLSPLVFLAQIAILVPIILAQSRGAKENKSSPAKSIMEKLEQP